MKKHQQLLDLCIGALCVALSLCLSYLKIPIGVAFAGFGGSIDLVMIPLIVYAIYSGFGWGVAAGLVFGTLKFFLAGGVAVNWQSMLLDYAVAYAFVGFAGIARRSGKYWLCALIGCAARFLVHFFSGITIYAILVPTEILGLITGSAAIYSVIYNGTYMLPNTVLAVVLCALLKKPIEKVLKIK